MIPVPEYNDERLSERVDMHLLLSLADFLIGEGEYLGYRQQRNPKRDPGETPRINLYAWLGEVGGVILGLEAVDPHAREKLNIEHRQYTLIGTDWTLSWRYQAFYGGDTIFTGLVGFVIDPTLRGDLDAWRREFMLLRVFHDTKKHYGNSRDGRRWLNHVAFRSEPQLVWYAR